MTDKQTNTYMALTAGSTFIMPSGHTIRFMGKQGGSGFYTTSDPAEIAELDKLHASPTAQIFREDANAATPLVPVLPPEVTQAAIDAAAPSERAASPAIAAAQAKIAGVIAANAR